MSETDSQWRQVLVVVVSLLVSAAVLAAVVWMANIDAEVVGGIVGAAELPWLLAAAGTAAGSLMLGADKLRRVLAATGVSLGFGEALLIKLASQPLGFISPARAGALLNVVYLSRREGMAAGSVVGVVAFDRGLNLVGTLAWMAVGLALLGELNGAAGAVILLTVVLSVYFVGTIHEVTQRSGERLSPRFGALIRDVLVPMTQINAGEKVWLLIYGLVFQMVPFVVGALCFRAMGHPISLAEAMTFIGAANLAAQTPGPMMGVGPREAALVALLDGRVPAEAALLAGLSLSLLLKLLPVLLGLFALPAYLRRLTERS